MNPKLILFIILGSFFISCKKTYTCSCTDPTGKVYFQSSIRTRFAIEKKLYASDCKEHAETAYIADTDSTSKLIVTECKVH